MTVALVHDYLTQRGGAERVVLSMMRAFPGAPLHTSLYDPSGTFPDFARADVRTGSLDRIRMLRRNHRLALPLLAPAFSRLHVSADVVLCSTSGWAHGTTVEGRKVVYCHSPARWLYQTDRYLAPRDRVARRTLAALRPYLVRWDRRAAASSHRYLANSTAVRDRIRKVYGIEAEVLPPPPALVPDGPQLRPDGVEPGFFLCVSRLLPYKNVQALIEAFEDGAPGELLVVGTGPDAPRLRSLAGPRIRMLETVSDDELRWLYSACAGVVSASYEDYGLSPLEAASFGKPAAVLRWGGFKDTVVEETGVFFPRPEPRAVAAALRELSMRSWDAGLIAAHAARFSEDAFVHRLREIVAEETA